MVKRKQALLESNLSGITRTGNRFGLLEKQLEVQPVKSVSGDALKKLIINYHIYWIVSITCGHMTLFQ